MLCLFVYTTPRAEADLDALLARLSLKKSVEKAMSFDESSVALFEKRANMSVPGKYQHLALLISQAGRIVKLEVNLVGRETVADSEE